MPYGNRSSGQFTQLIAAAIGCLPQIINIMVASLLLRAGYRSSIGQIDLGHNTYIVAHIVSVASIALPLLGGVFLLSQRKVRDLQTWLWFLVPFLLSTAFVAISAPVQWAVDFD
jgi:hypothetical protein